MTNAKPVEPTRDRVLYRGAWSAGVAQDWDIGLRDAERRLARRSRKVKKPVRHGILSCRADETLTEQQCEDAVATMAKELGCEGATILWAAHIDTDNFHLHAMFVTVDAETGMALPFGQEADGRAGYKEALQRAIARIEYAHHLQPEAGARYVMEAGEPVRKQPSSPIVGKRAPLPQNVLQWEEASGFVSFTRYSQDIAGPILDEACSWRELHHSLAPYGLELKKLGNGGALYAGEEHIKLSSVDRRHSWSNLKKRLGEFEPADDVEVAPYTPQIRDQVQAEKWLKRSQQLREVSENVDRRVAALMAARRAALAEIETQVFAHRADLAGFDGDARLRRDLAAAWPRLRAAAAAAIRAAFVGRIDAVRALRQAAASCDNLDAVDIAGLGVPEVGIVAPWHAPRGAPPVETLAGFDGERRGDVVCYWSQTDPARRGQPALVDTGPIIWVNDRSDRAVEAGLLLARERFGDVSVFGDAAYLRQCRDVAERLGIDIEVITVREAQRRTSRPRQDVERARRRAVGTANDRAADMWARRQAWALAYRRATPDESAVEWEWDDRIRLRHQFDIRSGQAEVSDRQSLRKLVVHDVGSKRPAAPGVIAGETAARTRGSSI